MLNFNKYHIFSLFFFLLFFSNINCQTDCIYKGAGDGYNININASQLQNYKASNGSYIYTEFFFYDYMRFILDYCNNPKNCGGYNPNALLCGIPVKNNTEDPNDRSWMALGSTEPRNVIYSASGVKISYVSLSYYEACQSRVNSTIQYKCDPSINGANAIVNRDLIGTCFIELTIYSSYFCQTCPNCPTTHGTCNKMNGWCDCDAYTKGINCDQLNVKISSIVGPTNIGGIVTIFGDFSNIYTNRNSIKINIGTLSCNSVNFTPNTLQITCIVGAGQSFQKMKFSDGNGLSSTYDGFYYKVLCSNDCTPGGRCNDTIGTCVCNDEALGIDCKTLNLQLTSVNQTFVSGGQVFLNGDFSKVNHLALNVEIGGQQCIDPKLNSLFTILQCKIGAGEGIKNITITSGKLSFTKDGAFQYQYYTCTNSCSPPHGSCNIYNGECICDNETFGNNCQFFQCPLNCSTASRGTCDDNTGKCICNNKYTGDACQFIQCPLNCSTPLHGTCDDNTGICACDNKYSGDACQFTLCPLNCSAPHGNCDLNTGICSCNNKYSGIGCEINECPLNCSTPHGTCNVNTGVCTCDNKYSGNGCEISECPLNCSTPHGTCNVNTGICTCDNKHSGDGCEISECPLNCSPPNGTCNVNTGICTCDNKHSGNGCEITECPVGCSTKHGSCDSKVGLCKCDTQTKGLLCEESRLLIESADSTNSNGGTTTIIGYFGTPTLLLIIKIGDSNCTNIKVINETTLMCDIGEGDGIHNVTIIDDDLSYTAINLFQYINHKKEISKISGGAIAGITIGCVAGISLLGAGGYYQYRRNKKVKLFI
ncbi:hypothetical protein RB653_005520 [Dictyostelium firmibasis]|uniref:EGF-like domain-containing protein n=1 Tax=Dictyostelium firmibasis TaxID=79012 RepID=A0AAN7UAD1_9MYCE